MSLIQALLQVLRRGLDLAAAALLLAVLAVISTQVAARYVFNVSMPWSEELTRLLFVWLVLIGASRARHMSIDIVPAALPPLAQRVLRVATALLGSALLALLVYQTLTLIELTAYDRFTALGVSVQYLYWALVIGGSLWIVLGVAEALLTQFSNEPSAPSA